MKGFKACCALSGILKLQREVAKRPTAQQRFQHKLIHHEHIGALPSLKFKPYSRAA